MKKVIFLTLVAIFQLQNAVAQMQWSICNAPAFNNRVDDVFMVNATVGYAVCGDGKIVKTTNGGINWTILTEASNVYCRSVEFINEQKGFVGAFSFNATNTTNILRKTLDGGATWIDLTSNLHPKTRDGICGLAVADSNTVYGCGNWFKDSSYIIKSIDGGDTWNYIDMSAFATSLIDMYFITKDTGFVTGRGVAPLKTGIILYTTDGGITWDFKFENTVANEYCWKIQKLTDQTYFAALEDFSNVSPSVLKSTDGGMSWTKKIVQSAPYNIEGIGFINEQQGWTGGANGNSFESNDGGETWSPISICPMMNRVFRVNDTLLFASGLKIWRYSPTAITVTTESVAPKENYIHLTCFPNPVYDNVTIAAVFQRNTYGLLELLNANGQVIKVIDSNYKKIGEYTYTISMKPYPKGIYYLSLKTHEDKKVIKLSVN